MKFLIFIVTNLKTENVLNVQMVSTSMMMKIVLKFQILVEISASESVNVMSAIVDMS